MDGCIIYFVLEGKESIGRVVKFGKIDYVRCVLLCGSKEVKVRKRIYYVFILMIFYILRGFLFIGEREFSKVFIYNISDFNNGEG